MLDEATVREVCERIVALRGVDMEEFVDHAIGYTDEDGSVLVTRMVGLILTTPNAPQPCPRGCVCADHFSQRGDATTPNVT